MLGHQERLQDELFVAGSLRDLIPDDYILRRVDRVLDLSWLRAEVEDLYCAANGRPGIDPEAAVRLMLAGFFQGIVHDRKLLREAQVNVAIRWFAGYRLDETLPDHSSLTRIRQRWGAERFKRIFERTVGACVEAGLVGADTLHVDATLIRADVSWRSLVAEHTDTVIAENTLPAGENHDQAPSGAARPGDRPRVKKRSRKKRSRTDPDATLATSRADVRLAPCYKQHTAVDDRAGVVVDAEVSTGEASEGQQLVEQLDRVEARLGRAADTVTADGAYAHGANYAALEARGIEAVIPPQAGAKAPRRIPSARFRYDAKHEVVRCPAGRRLRRSGRRAHGWVYRARAADCRRCRLRARCLSPTACARTIVIGDSHSALVRARRSRLRWDEQAEEQYRRHRWLVEGRHGEAKTQHGLGRAVRRGLANMRIQAYLTAAVMNLKRLAAFAARLFVFLRTTGLPTAASRAPEVSAERKNRFPNNQPTLAAHAMAA